MKNLLCALSLVFGVTAQAATINFDHLVGPGEYGPSTTNGFQDSGFTFSNNMDAIDVSETGDWWSNGVNGGHSGKFAAVNNYGGAMSMTKSDQSVFSVIDLWLNGWQGEEKTVEILGYFQGNLMNSLQITFSNPWKLAALNFSNIDTLVIDGENFLVDDIQIADTAHVDEPSSIIMLLIGLMGLLTYRKKI